MKSLKIKTEKIQAESSAGIEILTQETTRRKAMEATRLSLNGCPQMQIHRLHATQKIRAAVPLPCQELVSENCFIFFLSLPQQAIFLQGGKQEGQQGARPQWGRRLLYHLKFSEVWSSKVKSHTCPSVEELPFFKMVIEEANRKGCLHQMALVNHMWSLDLGHPVAPYSRAEFTTFGSIFKVLSEYYLT